MRYNIKKGGQDQTKRIEREVLISLAWTLRQDYHVDYTAYQDYQGREPMDLVLLHSIDAAAS